ncbi:NmrA family NAD(P)-binding protein [Planotetraspora mira]|uniref:Nucleotide-diphosphate-sugar epimerase n=1 Tax=Planotetraspora mira TaxID=58121 RepID=A0A8J3TMX5_9ACTN|nr:NmrA family NAD(P)-binding protein [Planotetraspora mira]GII28742.1 nucleotide-diphosphate-sugar epimerase [Planotetraspora mira]
MQDNEGARVLVLGASGRTGGMIAAALEAFPAEVTVVRASRDRETVERWRAEGRAAVHLDLDDARTFPAALEGVDRLFLMAGYTVAMTHQAKTIVDAAAAAGVGFIVHLGVFGDGRSTDPHFAWHELVERYIEGSGIPWTHLHPHMFMENLLTSLRLRDGRLPWPMGDKPTGWIAVEDLAAVAAKVLAEGPEIHAGKGYWMSTDLLNGVQAAEILRQTLDQPITALVMSPEDLLRMGSDAAPTFMEATYAASAMEWLQQTYDGRMDYAAVTTSTIEELLGRPALHLADWATRNRQALLSDSQAA